MPNFAEQTAAYLTGRGPVDLDTLKQMGLPLNGQGVESAFFSYRDTVEIPLQPLGVMQNQTQLFGREVGSNTARNLKLPITSDLSFFNYVITAYIDFGFDLEMDPDTNPVQGLAIMEAMNFFAQATRIEIYVSNKKYLDCSLLEFSNYEGPNVFTGLTGAASGAPFATSAGTFQQHHRIALVLDPPIIWPANSLVQINSITNVPAWVNDVTGSAVNPAVAPYNIKMQPTVTYNFVGNQARVTK